MKTQSYTHNPEFRVFFKFWLFISILLLLFTAIFYLVVNDGEPFQAHLISNWPILLILPFINSIINAYGACKHSFTISNVEDTSHVARWAVELLQKNGMRIKSEQESQTILEPAKGLPR